MLGNSLHFVDPPREPTIRYRHIVSPLGELLLVSDGEALRGLYLEHARYVPVLPAHAISDQGPFRDVVEQLEAYFAGERLGFSLTVAPAGTAFQRSVWQALAAINYGHTANYSGIAATVGRPRAFRAVGAANGHNPISVIVPCHRVIGTNGSLTGYAGGLTRKQLLLELEQRVLASAS
jgi:methylated-DNA-[protein]-cysteine S-methyltransferase